MESPIELNKYDNFIHYLITKNKDLLNNQESLTIEQIDMIVNNLLEKKTGLTIYNKPFLMTYIQKKIEEIKKTDESLQPNIVELSYEEIIKNIIPEIKFATLFKSNLDFSLVFDSDDVIILYQGKRIEIDDLNNISKDLIENKVTYLPEISEIYVENIIKSLELFMKKDLTVKYHCVDIPQPYWNLFEIKCNKTNPLCKNNMSKYLEINKIISGDYYKEPKHVQVTNQSDDPELQDILKQIKDFEENEKHKNIIKTSLSNEYLEANDGQYRMEIMSYLNDEQLMYFLDIMEKIDTSAKNISNSDDNEIINHIKLILSSNEKANNKMLSSYIVYTVFKFILKCGEFISKHDKLRQTITFKINDLSNELIIVKTAGLQFSDAIEQVIQSTRVLIDSIEKKKNPDYVPKWIGIENQEHIMSQIQMNKIIGPELNKIIGPEPNNEEPEIEPYSEYEEQGTNPGAVSSDDSDDEPNAGNYSDGDSGYSTEDL
jgi:hypothetical protein